MPKDRELSPRWISPRSDAGGTGVPKTLSGLPSRSKSLTDDPTVALDSRRNPVCCGLVLSGETDESGEVTTVEA